MWGEGHQQPLGNDVFPHKKINGFHWDYSTSFNTCATVRFPRNTTYGIHHLKFCPRNSSRNLRWQSSRKPKESCPPLILELTQVMRSHQLLNFSKLKVLLNPLNSVRKTDEEEWPWSIYVPEGKFFTSPQVLLIFSFTKWVSMEAEDKNVWPRS